MTCFAAVPTRVATPDPTKHVNYVQGMVLGVDDLTQEFTYLAQRDQWMARDLDGYGTVWGLSVSTRTGDRGPEVVVSPGVAVNPRGQLIRVAPAQCAALDEWLKPRASDVLARQIPTANPNLFQLPLWLTLSYRSCLTDPVPIAGEPCRSEDDSTAPSREADDFLLELLFDPPPQPEEDAVRALLTWLRAHLLVVPGSTPALTPPQLLDVIRAAAQAAQAAELSPVASPAGPAVYLLDSSPLSPLAVPPALVDDYLRAVIRLWITELRPMWRPNWLGQKHGCAGSDLLGSPEEGNRVLVARLLLTIGPAGLNSPVSEVQGPIDVDEAARPLLLDLRLLQEWLLGPPGAGAGGGGGAVVVAAGIVNANGTPGTRAALNDPRVVSSASAGGATNLVLTFDGYAPPPDSGGPQYLLQVLPWSTLLDLRLVFAGFQAGGLVLAVSKGGAALAPADLDGLQLHVEVTQVG